MRVSHPPVASFFVVPGASCAGYEMSLRENHYIEDPPKGAVAHVGGQYDGGWLTVTIWRSKQHADEWFAGWLGKGVAEVVNELKMRSDITYAMGTLIAFETGNGIDRWAEASSGDAIGFKASTISFEPMDMDRYFDEIDALRSGPGLPLGMALHAVAMFDDGPMAIQLSDEDPFGAANFGEFKLTLDDLSECVPAVGAVVPINAHTVTLGETLSNEGGAFHADPEAWISSDVASHSLRPLFLHERPRVFAGRRLSD